MVGQSSSLMTSESRKGTQREVLLFYGHTPESALKTSGKKNYQYLSNWSRCEFQYKGHTFYSSEQYLMWRKARLFRDFQTAKLILEAVTEGDLESDDKEWKAKIIRVKKLGREVSNFDEDIWAENRFQIMIDGLYEKFSQDESLKRILLSTGYSLLADSAARDSIWGTGMGAGNANAKNPDKWKGTNLLGKALMRVRKRLREESE